MGESKEAPTSSKKKSNTTITCERCKKVFPSKTALFRHLKASIGSSASCLKPEEVLEFMEKVINREENLEKIAILYGYIPSDYYLQQAQQRQPSQQKEEFNSRTSENEHRQEGFGLKDGDHAAQLLLEAVNEVSFGRDTARAGSKLKVNRSYGCDSRSDDSTKEQLRQDANTGAICEILCLKVPPFFHQESSSEEEKKANEDKAVQKWIQDLDTILSMKLQNENLMATIGGSNNFHHNARGKIQVFGRLTVSKKFNAEIDMSHRRIDYLLPADFLYGRSMKEQGTTFQEFCDMLVSFNPKRQTMATGARRGQSNNHKHYNNDLGILTYLHQLKRLMQRFCTPQVEKKVKRRRYHNFTPRMMAHEPLAYRRLDRFYHQATIRADEASRNSKDDDIFDIGVKSIGSRPFMVLSLKGDMFLNGQCRAICGLFVAIVLGYIEEDILECIFDEDYTNLVPAPVLPSFAQFAAEPWYATWEGKMKLVLCPRQCNKYDGWNTRDILRQVDAFQDEVYSAIVRAWSCCAGGKSFNETKQLQRCSNWLNDYLEPWSKKAKGELTIYRKWKEARKTVQESDSVSLTIASSLLPSLNSISSNTPQLYEKVLYYLREINSSNTWPSTTAKRQLVMVSISEGKNQYDSLLESHVKAQSKKLERESAYSFREGEGGASGSFSVGAMPGMQCEEPKSNKLFPELMKAAFELEIALSPDREPSSTIAVNRNAQFRPHVDNGAGAGQSRSLIVGLGTYVGGELMVEGTKHDIRYNPIEFNGWTERHWTLPFTGERYSLVWFTPKGCEGIRGIDLCK